MSPKQFLLVTPRAIKSVLTVAVFLSACSHLTDMSAFCCLPTNFLSGWHVG